MPVLFGVRWSSLRGTGRLLPKPVRKQRHLRRHISGPRGKHVPVPLSIW